MQLAQVVPHVRIKFFGWHTLIFYKHQLHHLLQLGDLGLQGNQGSNVRAVSCKFFTDRLTNGMVRVCIDLSLKFSGAEPSPGEGFVGTGHTLLVEMAAVAALTDLS